jgi:hypothetical protein
MTYREAHDALLRALHDAAERFGPDYITFEQAAKIAGVSLTPNWIARFVEDAEISGFAQVTKHLGPRETWQVRIRAAGSSFVESMVERQPDWGWVAEEPKDIAQPGRETPQPPAIDSASWTGRPTLPPENRERLAVSLRAAERSLDVIQAGNAEKAQARAYIIAALALAEAPEPQDDLIWEIVSRANKLSGIAALFVSIVGLFVV